ncbi:MAG: 4Fe-4S binding protein [Firmicutes bacterium]|nr:4Fe-4S binding protein [Bacillota bacterium]
MIRQIIHIDEDKCNGCGLCASACHEGAIGIVDGKAKLLRDDYCDGMGDCLPACPTGAITFENREAAAYDEAAVAQKKKDQPILEKFSQRGCPGSAPAVIAAAQAAPAAVLTPSMPASALSRLTNWPVQIRLSPVHAPYYQGAKLLIAADCTAFACGSFHEDFLKGKVCLVGCPKLDSIDYSEKLTEIIRNNDIKNVTVVRMQVPCCGGLELAVKKALQTSGKFLPWQVVTIASDGRILD